MRKFWKDLWALRDATVYSLRGLSGLIKERAFYQELLFGIVVLVIEQMRDTPGYDKTRIFSAYFLILMAECANTAIEIVIDRIGPERHDLSKKAKDVGSALVFLAIVHFGLIWISSFF
jgi:diacylglycerol kinase (ATP)